MPTYTYACSKCGHAYNVFHSMSASPKVKCERCGGPCVKQLGTGAGFIFKGSGFYETDFKDKKGTPDKKEGGEPKPEAKSESAPETKAEPKTETKAESATESKPTSKAAAKPRAKAPAKPRAKKPAAD